ncbi:hypothetical protein Avbf_09088 [Armadillidium vulgare]|nr:hypothetical protein Avbf_09088 [Armadillidium vulgare]
MKDKNIVSEPRFLSKVVNIQNLKEKSSRFTQRSSTHTSTTSIVSTDEQVDYQTMKFKNLPEKEDYVKYTNAIQVKDCGYAWVILGAMLLSNILTAGYLKSFGIIYNSVIVHFRKRLMLKQGS